MVVLPVVEAVVAVVEESVVEAVVAAVVEPVVEAVVGLVVEVVVEVVVPATSAELPETAQIARSRHLLRPG